MAKVNDTKMYGVYTGTYLNGLTKWSCVFNWS